MGFQALLSIHERDIVGLAEVIRPSKSVRKPIEQDRGLTTELNSHDSIIIRVVGMRECVNTSETISSL